MVTSPELQRRKAAGCHARHLSVEPVRDIRGGGNSDVGHDDPSDAHYCDAVCPGVGVARSGQNGGFSVCTPACTKATFIIAV